MELKSINDVKEAIKKLSIAEINSSAMKAIATNQTKKERFLELIKRSLNGDERSKIELKNICGCISTIVIDILSSINVGNFTIECLVDVAFSEDNEAFKSTVGVAHGARGADRDISIKQLQSMISNTPSSNNVVPISAGQGKQEAPSENNQNISGRIHSEDEKETSSENKYGRGVHIYGNKFALNFFQSKSKSSEDVIRLDVGAFKSKNSYDWAKKITFQFTPNEMPYLYGVFMGLLPEWESNVHSNNGLYKTFKIKVQDGGYYVSLSQSGENTSRGVPVPNEFTTNLSALVFTTIVKTYECSNVSETMVMKWIANQCGTYIKKSNEQKRA